MILYYFSQLVHAHQPPETAHMFEISNAKSVQAPLQQSFRSQLKVERPTWKWRNFWHGLNLHSLIHMKRYDKFYYIPNRYSSCAHLFWVCPESMCNVLWSIMCLQVIRVISHCYLLRWVDLSILGISCTMISCLSLASGFVWGPCLVLYHHLSCFFKQRGHDSSGKLPSEAPWPTHCRAWNISAVAMFFLLKRLDWGPVDQNKIYIYQQYIYIYQNQQDKTHVSPYSFPSVDCFGKNQ